MNVMGIGIIEIIEPLIHQQHYAARNSGTTCRGSPMRRQFWSRRDTGAREEPWPIQVGYSITCLHMLQNVASSENGGIKIIYILNIYIWLYIYVIYLVISWSQLIWARWCHFIPFHVGLPIGKKNWLFRKCMASPIRASGNGESHESRDAGWVGSL